MDETPGAVVRVQELLREEVHAAAVRPVQEGPVRARTRGGDTQAETGVDLYATEAEVRGDCPDARVHVPEARAPGIRAGLDLPVRDRAMEAG